MTYRPTTSATVGSSSTTTIRPGGSGLLTKVPRSCKKGNGYASTVRRKQPVKPVNRAKASRVRKHSDDSVRSGPIGAESTRRDTAWVNTEGCFAPPGPAGQLSDRGRAPSGLAIIQGLRGQRGRSPRDRGTLRARAGRLGPAGDRARRRQ